MPSYRPIVVAALLLACAGAPPTPPEVAPGPSASAEHVIPQTLGEGPLARVTVRVPRAYAQRVAGREVTVVEVLFRIENTGARPVAITALAVRTDPAPGGASRWRRPFRVEGERRVPPGHEETLHVRFALPGDVAPSELREVELQWVIQARGGARHHERSRFRRAPDGEPPAPAGARFVNAPYYPPELPV